jgi:uncharacterized membrane protein
MVQFYSSMGLVIVSIALYHVFQKLTAPSANPLLALTVTFGTCTLFCFVLFLFSERALNLTAGLRKLNWASIALAFAIVGTDLGFLLAYRAGWKISLGAAIANVTVTLLLLPIGWLFFSERCSPTTLAGVIVCVVGLALVNYK